MTTIPLLVGLADTNNIPRTRLILPALVGSQFGIGLFPIGMSTSLYLQKNEFLATMAPPTLWDSGTSWAHVCPACWLLCCLWF